MLEKIDPEMEFLMTLYLSPDLTPDEIRKAKKAGIIGSSSASGSASVLMSIKESNHIRGVSQLIPRVV
jgi:hypothetical protein